MQRQRERKKIELWTCSTLYCHFFAVVLHDYNDKLPSYTLYGGNVVHCMCSCLFFFFFFLFRSFLSWWPLACLTFSWPLLNFLVFLPNKFVSMFVCFCLFIIISHPCSFSVIHVNVDIKIWRKKDAALTTVNLTSRAVI